MFNINVGIDPAAVQLQRRVDEYIYLSDLSKIIQFNINQSNPVDIENSAYVVVSSPFTQYASIQRGPDDVICINSGSIDAILNPNEMGIACNFVPGFFTDQTSGGGYGLPKYVYKQINSNPSYEIIANQFCVELPTEFSIQNPVGIDSVQWDFGDSNSLENVSFENAPSHQFSSISQYVVSAYIYKECGVDTIQITVDITDCPAQNGEVFAPNVITPNNDGINDFFILQKNQEKVSVFILNRWGNTVFETTNYLNDWDGMVQRGQALSEGVYTYRYIVNNGDVKHGFLHLIR